MKSVLTEALVFSIALRCVELKLLYNTISEEIFRVTTYSPRVIRKSCLLKPDSGPCRANMTMFHFDPAKGKCEQFAWGGCQGNGNRFETASKCFRSCVSKPHEKSKRPRYCDLSFDYGFCFGDVKRWYYDHLWKVCKETIYSGCGGNMNNFHTMEQCDSSCRFGREVLSPYSSHGSSKKVLIINPQGATTPASRGKNQTPPQLLFTRTTK